MNDIWKIIATIGIELHPDRVKAGATKIATLSSVDDFDKARSSFGPAASKTLVNNLDLAWRNESKLSPLEIAAALRGASVAAAIMEKQETVEMVWTGPLTGIVASRHTEQVLHEVINSAKSKLFIVSFVAYDIEPVIKALQEAINRKVTIDILLESSKNHGGKVDIDSAKSFKKKIPLANLYAWNSELKSPEKWKGAVHAKCAVADGKLAFITSANLTMAAMEKNMELGVLIREGDLPKQLEKHLNALVDTNIIMVI